jgi:FMN reductase
LHATVISPPIPPLPTQGLQAINVMEFSVRALRGWAVPYVVPVASAARVFGDDGRLRDANVGAQLAMLGAEVVRVAEHFASDATAHRQAECDLAAERASTAVAA